MITVTKVLIRSMVSHGYNHKQIHTFNDNTIAGMMMDDDDVRGQMADGVFVWNLMTSIL